YEYTIDKKGKPQKNFNPEVNALIQSCVSVKVEVSDEEIIMRMMLPMIIESSRCLEDKIVKTPVEVDMGLLLGLGFPPFRAGALKYADSIGLARLEEESKKYHSIGALYEFTPFMKDLSANNKTYY
ncbi:MAG: hypothetical protein WDA09_03615, partial [Bacteriovoracaceae bacterium]